MFKKFLLIPIAILMFVFGFFSSAQAYIQDETDLAIKIESLKALRDYDSMTFINKADLIGYRLEEFNSARSRYNSNINNAIDQLYQIQNSLQANQYSNNSEQAKQAQRQKLLLDANTIISNVNTQANFYIDSIRYPMPILTYEKYRNKFWDFYNSLGL